MKLHELNVMAAIDAAPVIPSGAAYPDAPIAVTSVFLTLLRKTCTWRRSDWLGGGAIGNRTVPPAMRARVTNFVTPFGMSTAEGTKIVWWVGDSALRCAVSRRVFDLLCRGRARADGTLTVDGVRWRLKMKGGMPNRAVLVRAP